MTSTSDYSLIALLLGSAGIAAGAGLSFTHGTIGRSARPHRLFALVNTALGVFGIFILSTTPRLIAAYGGPALLWVLAAVMLTAATVSAIAFPAPEQGQANAATKVVPQRIPASVRFGALGMGFFSLMNSTAFSFVERIGSDRGFGLEAVSGVLITIGIVNLFPGPLAGLLEQRFPARTVVFAGPIIHAALVLTLTQSTSFMSYALGTCFLPAMLIFVNTFAFGLLARLDLSGRVLAASPAMVMAGAALGPILGGTLVKLFGYSSLGLAVVMIAPLTLFCFAQIRREGEAAQLTT
jgi:predicted MFS family arabinose efflux permease